MTWAMFAAGCFWSVEAAFRGVAGVVATAVGFSGGHVEEPSYEEVATGTSGHAQTVRIEYDPERIAFPALLELFWRLHDAASHAQAGGEPGSPYRFVIFFHDDAQRALAEASLRARAASGAQGDRIRVEIVAAGRFHPAAEEHQRYYEKRGRMALSLFGRSCPDL
jgi:peptide-methionine (S)-S-oxide reductase